MFLGGVVGQDLAEPQAEERRPSPSTSGPSGTRTRLVERIQLVLALWILALILGFIATAISVGVAHPLPRWLELPWNGVNDYTVGTDGRIWLHVGLHGMLLSYDSRGRFLGSRPGFTSGSVCLTAAADGRLFLLNSDTVHTLSAEGDHQSKVAPERPGAFVWRLAADGSVEHDPNPAPGSRAGGRPALPGELLFGEECRRPRPRLVVETPDDGRVYRRFGPRLEIVSPDGTSVSFTGPWYFLWAQFSFAWVPWVCLVVWNRIESRRKKGG